MLLPQDVIRENRLTAVPEVLRSSGRDPVYGNRDVKGYENGRRDVEKIVRAFKGLPADVSNFYLQRLANEILEKGVKQSEKASQNKAAEKAVRDST